MNSIHSVHSAGVNTSWVVPNLTAIAGLFNIYCKCDTGVAGGDFRLTSITNGNARGGNRRIEEENLAAYIQADFEVDAFGMPLRGNLGVRQVNTVLNANGFSSIAGGTPGKPHGACRCRTGGPGAGRPSARLRIVPSPCARLPMLDSFPPVVVASPLAMRRA